MLTEKELNGIASSAGDLPVIEIRTRLIVEVLTRGDVVIDEKDHYPHRIAQSGFLMKYRAERIEKETEKLRGRLDAYRSGMDVLLYTAEPDFSHTVPDWEKLFRLGFCGVAREAEERGKQEGFAPAQARFYDCVCRVYRAIPVYLEHLADACGEKYDGVRASLRAIAQRPPETLRDVLTMMIAYYTVQTELDSVILRSMGCLDALLLPYYENDLASGVPEEELDDLISHFFLQLREFGFYNNIPFCIGTTDMEGHSRYNRLSYRLLTIYRALNVQDPKIQIRCGSDTPDDMIDLAMDMIRGGNNSIVFMNDTAVLPALADIGIAPRDAERYIPVGCYEPLAYGELPCTCAGRVSLPKAVELTLSDGVDRLNGRTFARNPLPNSTWENFMENYRARLAGAIEASKAMTARIESAYGDMNPSVVLSALCPGAMEKGVDVYSGGAVYNDSSINVFGLATAVDALEAIRHMVFEEKRYTCRELQDILDRDWEGHERERLLAERRYPKYGNGDAEADALTREITRTAAECLNGKPNGRGGVFRMGMFSIDGYELFGSAIGATADGRHARDVISKNMSAVIGRDREGVTGILRSAACADGRMIPNGTALDLNLDASAARGQEGLVAMRGILRAFFGMGATALQINVLDPAVLRRAKEDPGSYSTLQVRLCGWNVYFTQLSEREQDEFIAMAEHNAAH